MSSPAASEEAARAKPPPGPIPLPDLQLTRRFLKEYIVGGRRAIIFLPANIFGCQGLGVREERLCPNDRAEPRTREYNQSKYPIPRNPAQMLIRTYNGWQCRVVGRKCDFVAILALRGNAFCPPVKRGEALKGGVFCPQATVRVRRQRRGPQWVLLRGPNCGRR